MRTPVRYEVLLLGSGSRPCHIGGCFINIVNISESNPEAGEIAQ